MKAQEIMTTEVVSVDKKASIRDAAMKMAESDVGSVIVNDNKSLVGIITDRDITIRGVAENTDLNNVTCEKVMSKNVVTANSNTDMEDVIDLMSEHQIKRVPIVENENVIGMISLRDISQTIEWDDEAGEVLNDITD
ncbi:MAG: CBS domain-containing protein [Firmicutes bacterium HGW-Firmicutes-7]|nr:MAG: CBS domain-containing protein [Firmicutes bacterium HGW-Firmicutes-7]